MTDQRRLAPRLRARPITVTPSLERRFWAKVDTSGGPGACWMWTGGVDPSGYGYIAAGAAGQGCYRAHRVAWTLQRGPIPPGFLVCHRCDVRACCNGSHHFLGTEADNNQDAIQKGRHRHGPGRPRGSRGAHAGQARGAQVHTAKLTEVDVVNLRNWASRGVARATLARAYELNIRTVADIIRRETWAHVA